VPNQVSGVERSRLSGESWRLFLILESGGYDFPSGLHPWGVAKGVAEELRKMLTIANAYG